MPVCGIRRETLLPVPSRVPRQQAKKDRKAGVKARSPRALRVREGATEGAGVAGAAADKELNRLRLRVAQAAAAVETVAAAAAGARPDG